MSRFHDAAVTRVDARYGYSLEFASDPDMHRRMYAEEEEHLMFLSRCKWIAEDMNAVFKKLWLGMYPTGHCGCASLTLIEVLRASTTGHFKIVVGTAGHQDSIHVWIETTDGDIIDVTFGQFLSTEAAVNPVRVLHYDDRHNLNHQPHRVLTPDEEQAARLGMVYEEASADFSTARSPVIKAMLMEVNDDKQRARPHAAA